MKAIKFILICNLLICNLAIAQSITNTLGASGLFSIKDGSATYLSLSQSTGYLSLNRSLTLQPTSGSNIGVIYKGTDRFLHNYGNQNTFLGINSGNFTMTGGYNSAYGWTSLYSNTNGILNSAFGVNSLFSNTDGGANSAFGAYSLTSNTTGYGNSAFGESSLCFNTTGLGNSAFGEYSLSANTEGNYNSAFGFNSLISSTTGIWNSAFGVSSLYHNTTGYNNTGFGGQSLFSNTIGYNNSAFGFNSGNNIMGGFNNTSIGYDALVPNGNANNQVRIGNTSVTYAGVQVAWTITSDRKWKENIISSPLGLKFISRLNPVSYIRINDESKKTEYGLIAQEVEEVLKDEGAENSSMITVTDEGNYELRYNDLLAPMIKAIQELNEENQNLKLQNENLEMRLAKLEQMILNSNQPNDVKLIGK